MRYGDLQAQGTMALDAVRNAAYERALAACVTPGSVVLDLGAGIGILGLLALKRGARRVYCVEPQDIGALAKELAASNGWAGRLIFVQGRIQEVELPEEVDVIVSAMTGNLLFNEDLLPAVFHARDTYLRPGGTLVPSSAALDAVAVSARPLVERYLARWSDDHLGIDVTAARRYAANAMVLRDRLLRDVEALGPARELFTLDMSRAAYERLDASVALPVHRAASCDGVAAWMRLRLGDEELSTGPFDAKVHWSPAFIPCDPPLAVRPGEELALRLTRAPFGDWAWRLRSGRGETREGTTFFSRPRRAVVGAADEDRRPTRSRRAAALADVIEAMDGSRTVAEIVAMLGARYPDEFPTRAGARRMVSRVVASHARPADDPSIPRDSAERPANRSEHPTASDPSRSRQAGD